MYGSMWQDRVRQGFFKTITTMICKECLFKSLVKKLNTLARTKQHIQETVAGAAAEQRVKDNDQHAKLAMLKSMLQSTKNFL